jgi:hypothetical protein
MSSVPVGVAAVAALPHGRTAQRLTWKFLPPPVRARVEEWLGGSVVDAVSQDGGFTPGFASVLTAENGERLFVKAASAQAQREIAGGYRVEAEKRRLLGDAVPAPALRWQHDEDWVVLGFEAVDGRPPRRPWRADELTRALDLAADIAGATRRLPDGLDLVPLWEDVPALLTGWDDVPDSWPHRAPAAELARSLPQVQGADRFVHADLRDDNVLLCADGRTLACDWNWPALGPVWLDLVDLLVAAHGDGHDADGLLAGHDLTRDVAPDEVDAWLAAFCGYMLSSRAKPVPPSSPYLRQHASWYAEAAWSWLAARRGWT